MYESIRGKLIELNPSYAVVECNNGFAYFLNISLYTYSRLKTNQDVQLFLEFIVREDSHQFYAFHSKTERETFRKLVSVSGVGANTARTILSSISPKELVQAIQAENYQLIKSVKGIGTKSAQRIIVDLKDKILKDYDEDNQILSASDNTIRNESFEALAMLGFPKQRIEKVLGKLLAENNDMNVEELVKNALKEL